jgi:hypothetical protein
MAAKEVFPGDAVVLAFHGQHAFALGIVIALPSRTAASSSAVRTRTPTGFAHVSQETLLEARCASG